MFLQIFDVLPQYVELFFKFLFIFFFNFISGYNCSRTDEKDLTLS